jgi:hypothetical protein
VTRCAASSHGDKPGLQVRNTGSRAVQQDSACKFVPPAFYFCHLRASLQVQLCWASDQGLEAICAESLHGSADAHNRARLLCECASRHWGHPVCSSAVHMVANTRL